MAVRTAFIFNILAVLMVLAQGATNACVFCLHDAVEIVSASHCHEAHVHCDAETGEHHQHEHEHSCKPGAEFNLAQRASADHGASHAHDSIVRAPSPLFAIAEPAQPACDASPPNQSLRPYQQPILLC